MRFALNVLAFFLIFRPVEGHSLPFDSAAPDARGEAVTTRHTVKVGGAPLNYTARAGFIPIRDEATGAVHAQIFFVSYTVQPRRGEPARPLTFYTNGGPVAPATLSDLGPRTLKGEKWEGVLPSPPYEMVDNEQTWLSTTDLVLIDPVGTGYSRATQPGYASEFYNPDGDAESVTQFIQLYLKQYDPGRRQPTFVAGFSYGSFRSALIADIANRRGIALRGLILLSSVLGNAPRHTGFPLPDPSYPQLIPSFTATAFVHAKLSPDLQGNFDEAIGQAEAWAVNEYPKLLDQADDLSADQLGTAAAEMAHLTGLSPEVVLYNRFRFKPDTFLRNLLGAQWTPAGLFDSRLKAGDPFASGQPPEWYKVLSDLYLGEELHSRSEFPYGAGFDATVKWRCNGGPSTDCFSDPQVLVRLQRAMRENPSLQVMITNGYYDFAAPYFGSKLAIGQLEPDLRARVNVTYDQTGHYAPPEPRGIVIKFIQRVSKLSRERGSVHGQSAR
jgi:carboxypeptidase C (cathepsin A)